MKNSTRVFLVLLRLVIGWHFLSEGILAQNEDQVTSWILGLPPEGKKKVVKSSPYAPPVETEKTTPERLAAYIAKRDEVRRTQQETFRVSVRTIFASQENASLRAD